MAIEIDGGQHYTEDAREYDTKRTKFLNSRNILVYRVTNLDIDRNFEAVCRDIDRTIEERKDHPISQLR